MKKIWQLILGSLLVILGAYWVLTFRIMITVYIGIFLNALGLELLLDLLRARLVKPAPAYRYRAQELGIIFRGPPR